MRPSQCYSTTDVEMIGHCQSPIDQHAFVSLPAQAEGFGCACVGDAQAKAIISCFGPVRSLLFYKFRIETGDFQSNKCLLFKK